MTERTTILIVDDESKIRRLLSRSLEAEGFDVAVADSAMSASEYLKNGHCDLIILDYMMPEIDGMAFLAELRKKSSIPVIMLSAREEIAKKTQALELGADDYVVKPFSIEEMTARIRAILRRSGGVKTGEVDPKTMASKKAEGLFFAGELLDCDAYTGGFNLQIAWATGRLAGQSAACERNNR